MIRILRRWGGDKRFQTSVLGVSTLVVLVTLFATAWIAEDAQITFVKDAEGKVIKLLLKLRGRKMTAKKIE